MSPEHAELHAEVSDAVKAAITGGNHALTAPPAHGVNVGIATSMAVALPLVERAVQMAIDVAVESAGPAFNGMVQAERDKVKAVLSEKTLAFLQGVIHGLQGVAAA